MAEVIASAPNLGYCSESMYTRKAYATREAPRRGQPAQIQTRLHRLHVSVRDYQMDFRPGSSILEEIERASLSCTYGVFLFSEDDRLEGSEVAAAPRDNVVFEAGYFMRAKGPKNCLIIRCGQAKMPADVGQGIYAHLDNKADIDSIVPKLQKFLGI
jgi:predicted nucleotide-binding protein